MGTIMRLKSLPKTDFGHFFFTFCFHVFSSVFFFLLPPSSRCLLAILLLRELAKKPTNSSKFENKQHKQNRKKKI